MKKYLFIFFVLVSIFFFFDKVYAIDYLSSLNASGTDLTLEKEKFDYHVNYSGSSGVTKIYATLSSEKYSYVNGYGPRTVNLNFGSNEVLVKVVDDIGQEITYTINIDRNDERANNNYLTNIVVNGKALNFDSEKQVYSFSVSSGVTKLNIRTSTSDKKATYNIFGGDNLVVGDNTVTIRVFSESGEIRDYVLKVYRSSSKTIPMSSNTNLSLLKIEGHDIEFSSDVYEYKVLIKEEVPLEIKAMAEDEKATVKIVGNRSIKHNDTVEVRVIAEDGSQDIYKIKVMVEGMSNIDILTIVIIVLSIIVLISAAVVISSMLKRRKDKSMEMNFQVVKNEIPKIDVTSTDDKKLMSFLLGQDNNQGNNVLDNNNSNSNVISNNSMYNNYSSNNGSVKICAYCGNINNSMNTNCTKCGNRLGG